MVSRKHIFDYTLFALLVVLMGLFSVHTLTSIYQDIGRHITVGQLIWESGNIPSTNLFSFTAPDFLFVNHHWLGGVLLYLGDRFIGLAGLIVFKALLLSGAFALALAASWRNRLSIPAMIIGLASIFTIAERTDVRPEIFSFLFLAWFLFVLYRYPRSKLLWTLPFVQLVWVNTHIYFFMGPLLWLAFLIGVMANQRNWKFEMSNWRESRVTNYYVPITLLLILATLTNPSGWHGALYPLTMWSNYGYSIVENQSLFFLRAFGYPMMTSIALGFTILLTLASFIINRRHLRKNVDSLVLFVSTTIFALLMLRNFPLLAFVAIPITLRNLSQSPLRFDSKSVRMGMHVILILIGISIVTNQIYDQAGIGGRRFGLVVPEGFQEPVDFFRSAGLRGPLFNNFDVGSFLIWKLPEEKVFIDGRPEAYPADFIQNTYIKMQEDPSVWARESERYNLNTIFWSYQDITPWSQAFMKRITKDPQWVAVYMDKGIIILVRDTPANSSIIAKYRLK